MRRDGYRICANCRRFKPLGRYHGECRGKTELRGTELVRQSPLRRRWNDDARNCELFEGQT